ncbi:hypothetical protein CBS101457_005590 [Exobasidium rhododendri]|nr:hypothetical protein CBS101457_005590 [Exobasidium rhododendri]
MSSSSEQGQQTWFDYAGESVTGLANVAYIKSKEAVTWLANATHLDISSLSNILPTTTSATDTPRSSSKMSKVEISKKSNIFCKKGSREVDWAKVAKHLDRVHTKVQRNFDTFKATSGKEHQLRSTKHTPKKAPTTSTGDKAAASTGTVALTDETEELWHGAISFGGQTIQVDFDTGSSDVIINKGAYTPGSSAQNTNKTFSTAYGDGTTAKGEVYLDTLEIAGLSAPNAAIGLSSTTFLQASEGDNGIAGMAYPALAQLGQPPFFDSLISAGVLQESVFTFTLADTGSGLFLGGIPSNVTNPTYVSVDSSQGFWGVTGSINGTSTAGILDTGTTLIVAPVDTATALFKKLGLTTSTQDGSIYGLYDASSPPTITIEFGGFSQVLSSATTSFGTQNGQEVLSIVGSDVGAEFVIFGDSFLRNVNAVFDRQNNRAGFTSQ